MATFGERLKELREEAGLTLDKLGEVIGVRKNAVYRWETGEYRPSEENALLIAGYFKVPHAYLMGATDYRTERVLSDEEAAEQKAERAKQDEEQMLLLYRMLSPEMQKMIRTTVNQAHIIDKDRDTQTFSIV